MLEAKELSKVGLAASSSTWVGCPLMGRRRNYVSDFKINDVYFENTIFNQDFSFCALLT